MVPRVDGKTELSAGNYVRLVDYAFTDDRNRVRHWEGVERTNCSGAVMIIARLLPEDSVLLVRQFRPPTGRKVIEFPAGLLDIPGESVSAAAERELYEETGYAGKIVRILPKVYSSPGLSGEGVTLVLMTVDSDAYPVAPETHNEDSESIEVLRVPRQRLADFLSECQSRGDAVEAKVALAGAMWEKSGFFH